jgi:hypothetical protein
MAGSTAPLATLTAASPCAPAARSTRAATALAPPPRRPGPPAREPDRRRPGRSRVTLRPAGDDAAAQRPGPLRQAIQDPGSATGAEHGIVRS